jgi:molybdate transport system substrate-binding protein
MTRRTPPVFLLLVLVGLGACGAPAPVAAPPPAATVEVATSPTPTPEAYTLTVYAAASLTDGFTEIGQAFEAANPGARVVFNFAGSQALRTQIEEGARADVFASANTKEMEALAAGGNLSGEALPFVTNLLTIIVPADNPAQLMTPQDLALPGLKLVLAAEEVPVGMYARQALDNMQALYGDGYREAVLANLASNEDNVKQVVAKVQLGEADAGIVYETDALASPELGKIEIPGKANVVAVYPIAVLAGSAQPDEAQAFIDFVLSDAGQALLRARGFRPPVPPS